MNLKDEDSLSNELIEIDLELEKLEQKIIYIEIQKANLLKRKKACTAKLKELKPTSSGGYKHDSSSNWNRKDFKWSQQIDDRLKDVFKLESFRPLQLETINVTLSKQDCLVVIPTGGGKSLCYQLPAIVDSGVTLVVSPLVSLMEDQLWSLRLLNISAEKLTSTTHKDDQKRILASMLDTKSNMKILYVTPEKLAKSKMFMNKLEKMYDLNRFNRLVIDEVHCCSTYGHDFRPDYKFLGIMKRQFPNICILGLTATATSNVIEDLRDILNLKNFVLFKSSFNRPNLYYEVREKPSNHEACMENIADLIKTRFSGESGIVYCFSQKETEQVAIELSKRSIKASPYHAYIDPDQKSRVHTKWLNNETHVIVATIAFGMGIDKPNCRFVIHHSLSKSLENFYQESGRAGRDGNTAYSILYFRFADIFRQSSMVFTERTGLENLYSMVTYCIDKKACKRQLIAQHFKDNLWTQTGNCHKMCDVCDKSDELVEVLEVNCISESDVVFRILEKHSGKDKRLTANKLAELSGSEITKSKELTNKLNKNQVEQLIIELLLNQYLREEFSYTPYSTICYLVKAERYQPKNIFNVFFLRENFNNGSNNTKKSLISKKKKNCTTSLSAKSDMSIEAQSIPSNKRKSNAEIVVLDSSDDDVNNDTIMFVTKKNKN